MQVALVKCKGCGKDVSKNATACPHCGEPLKGKPAGCGSVIVAFFLVAVAIGAINNALRTSSRGVHTNSVTTEVSAQPPKEFKWKYYQGSDKMTGRPYYTAYVESSNQVNFGYPYSGLQRATLTLRTHPQWGKGVIFAIERGQMLCGIDSCYVHVRFGDGSPVRYKVSEPADHSTEYLFINDYWGFVKNMLAVDRVFISADIYQEGRPVFEFSVRDFQQDKYVPSK